MDHGFAEVAQTGGNQSCVELPQTPIAEGQRLQVSETAEKGDYRGVELGKSPGATLDVEVSGQREHGTQLVQIGFGDVHRRRHPKIYDREQVFLTTFPPCSCNHREGRQCTFIRGTVFSPPGGFTELVNDLVDYFLWKRWRCHLGVLVAREGKIWWEMAKGGLTFKTGGNPAR